MRLRNFMIFGIDKDSGSDRLIYYCRDLDSPNLDEFIIEEMGKKFPSDFLTDVLMSNGYFPFKRGEIYIYDYDLINSFTPLLFNAICDKSALNGNNGIKGEVKSYDMILIPDLKVREIGKLRKAIENSMMNCGDGF